MIDLVTFDDLYPRAEIGHESEASCVICVPTLAPCWICGRITRWVSVSFEAHVCSAICDDLAWVRFWREDFAAAEREREDDHSHRFDAEGIDY